jgi:putative inorganic carbon (hco3(-)) transporter
MAMTKSLILLEQSSPDNLIEGRKKLVAYCLGFIMLFLIGNQVRSLEAIDGLMCVLVMIGWILVIAGFWSLLFTDYQFGNRLKVFNMNEGALGYYFTITLPGVIWPVLQSSGHRRRLYMALSVVFILCAMILVLASGGRGSSISMVIMLLAFWFWKPLRPWGMMGGVLVAGMLIAAPILLASLNNRANDNWGTKIGDRELLWIASVHLIEDHPLTGMGVGNGPFELLR